jgi:hypothetical protein
MELTFLLYVELMLLSVELKFFLYVELMYPLYAEMVFLSSENLCRMCTLPCPQQSGVLSGERARSVCLPSSQYTQEQTGYLFLRNRSYLTMPSLNNLCRTNVVHLDEFMNYICAGTLLLTKKSSVFILSTLLNVSWYWLVVQFWGVVKSLKCYLDLFMSYTTWNRGMNS